MGQWKTPVYLRIVKGKDDEGQKKYAIIGASCEEMVMKNNTLAILEIELDIDEAYLDPITHAKATISMADKPPNIAAVRSGLQQVAKDVKDLQ